MSRLGAWLERLRCRWSDCSFPCGDFKDNGSFGCLTCDWNLAAHSESDQRRVLGDEFYEQVQRDLEASDDEPAESPR